MEQVQNNRPQVEVASVFTGIKEFAPVFEYYINSVEPIKPKPTWKSPSYYQLKTQKAKGIYFISQIAAHNYGIPMYNTNFSVIPVKEFIDAEPEMQFEMIRQTIQSLFASYSPTKPLFARPCPTVPRHGFVDSRVLYLFDNKTQQTITFNQFHLQATNVGGSAYIDLSAELYEKSFREIIKETYDADPNGEVVFMYYLDPSFNYIATPGSLTIGEGHDGATAGRNAVTLPIVNNFVTLGVDSVRPENIGIAEGETPYYELIQRPPQGVHLVQIRSGPKVQAERDFIPDNVTVEQVIKVDPDMSLLEWEAVASSFQGKPGVVVYHAGGSVNSHFGVHCVINKLPYVTSSEPYVGQQLSKIERKQWHDKDYFRLAQHVAFYDSLPTHNQYFSHSARDYASVGLASLHALVSLLSSRNDYSMRAIAIGLAFTARLFNTIAVGELRHARKQSASTSFVYELFSTFKMSFSSSDARHDVYCEAMNEQSFIDIAHKYTLPAYYIYAQPGWNDSYGGKAWRECAHGSLQFTRKLAKFIQEPSEQTFTTLMNEFNNVVHLAHNNGWWLNKVISNDDFNTISKEPSAGYMNGIAYGLLRLPETNNDYNVSINNLGAILSRNNFDEFNVYREYLKEGMSKAVECEENCIEYITESGYAMEEQ